eukprot:scaffold652_cov260-Pinguiococcus_pyrenoidosus.AAC.3
MEPLFVVLQNGRLGDPRVRHDLDAQSSSVAVRHGDAFRIREEAAPRVPKSRAPVPSGEIEPSRCVCLPPSSPQDTTGDVGGHPPTWHAACLRQCSEGWSAHLSRFPRESSARQT